MLKIQDLKVFQTTFHDDVGKIGQNDNVIDLREIDHFIRDLKQSERIITGNFYSFFVDQLLFSACIYINILLDFLPSPHYRNPIMREIYLNSQVFLKIRWMFVCVVKTNLSTQGNLSLRTISLTNNRCSHFIIHSSF